MASGIGILFQLLTGVWSGGRVTSAQFLRMDTTNALLVSSLDVYQSDGTTLYFSANYNTDIAPFISTNQSYIINWSFANLVIDGGSYIDNNSSVWLNMVYNNNEYSFDVTDYISNIEGSYKIYVPKSLLTSNIVIRSGSAINFDVTVRNGLQTFNFDLGGYTLDLTAQSQQEINEDSDKQVLSDINSNQHETNEKLDNIEETITNPSIDNDSIFLPSDNTNDITQEGLNGIFTSIYNAFCTGQAQDIVFPIPFTNKNITLHANYVRQMLINSNSNWVITIIEAFWWYLISRFIIKDITNKITKIKSGNIEDIENNNIKGDML